MITYVNYYPYHIFHNGEYMFECNMIRLRFIKFILIFAFTLLLLVKSGSTEQEFDNVQPCTKEENYQCLH